MDFNVGDFVKGNALHCNPERMDDVGVVVEVLEENKGYWVCWFKDKEKHFAEEVELKVVERVWV